MVDNESVEELTDKCRDVSEKRKVAADRLWNSETEKCHAEDEQQETAASTDGDSVSTIPAVHNHQS